MLRQVKNQAVPRKLTFMSITRTAISKFSDDRCSMMGASIGFFSAFSLAPTLLIVLAVTGWFFGPDAAKGRLFDQVKGVLGNDAASAMQSLVEHAHRASGSGIAAALSIVLVAVGASATFSSLNTALDVVFGAHSPKGIAGLALLLRARLISFGMVMGLAFLLVVSLVLDTNIQSGAVPENESLHGSKIRCIPAHPPRVLAHNRAVRPGALPGLTHVPQQTATALPRSRIAVGDCD